MDIDRLHNLVGDISKLYDGIDAKHREFSEEDEPSDMDTIAQLIDKLITVDLKMWHNQEFLYKCRRQTKEEFIQEFEENPGEMYETIKRCCDLNCQRNKLMDAIDQRRADELSGRISHDHLTQKSHKTY